MSPKIGSIDDSLSEALNNAIDNAFCAKHKTRKRKYNGGARCIECEDEEYYEAKRKEREQKKKWAKEKTEAYKKIRENRMKYKELIEKKGRKLIN